MGGAGGTAWLNEVLGRLGQFEIEKTMVVCRRNNIRMWSECHRYVFQS